MKGSLMWIIPRYCGFVSICNVLLLVLIITVYLMGKRAASFQGQVIDLASVQSEIIDDWEI